LQSETSTALELRYLHAGEERRVVVDHTNFLIGRAPDCALTLSDDSVSRRHARILRSPAGWTIEDLDSKNGLRINGVRTPQQPLRDGDRVDVGGVRLLARVQRGGRTTAARVVFEPERSPHPHTEVIDLARLDSLLLPAHPGGEPQPAIAPEQPVDAGANVKLFSDAAEALITCDSLDETLERILDLVFDNLPAERGVICLYDEASDETSPQVMRTREGAANEPIRISSQIAGDVIRRKRALLVNDPLHDERFGGAESIILMHIRSAMCAPLYRDGRVAGFVYLDRQSGHQPFDRAHLHTLSALAVISAVAVEQASLRDRLRDEEAMRTRLARYSSPAVVERIVGDAAGSGAMAAEEADVTVLFADLAGFTSLAETLDPSATLHILNQVLEQLTQAIFEFEGTLDKFHGDGVMAFFGAPLPADDHAPRAVAAAIRMQELLTAFNTGAHGPPLQMRIGINSGTAIVGDVGAPQRRDYTVIGDVVNTASRLQSSVALPEEIVIGQETWLRVQETFTCEALEPTRLKGKRRLVEPYRVICARDGTR
jgi:adenylate cyclase